MLLWGFTQNNLEILSYLGFWVPLSSSFLPISDSRFLAFYSSTIGDLRGLIHVTFSSLSPHSSTVISSLLLALLLTPASFPSSSDFPPELPT